VYIVIKETCVIQLTPQCLGLPHYQNSKSQNNNFEINFTDGMHVEMHP
jgi:hypothetical protein